MLVTLQKSVTTADENFFFIFRRELKIPIEPIIGMSIKGLCDDETESDDTVVHIFYNLKTKELILIMDDSIHDTTHYDSVAIIKQRHANWVLIKQENLHV